MIHTQVVFDIGGTHMRFAEHRPQAGNVTNLARMPTPRDPQAAVDAIVGYAKSLGKTVTHIYGGVMGTVDDDHRLCAPPHIREWDGFPLAFELSGKLICNVRVHNDNALAALAEACLGAGRNPPALRNRIIAQIRLGTGVGGARVVDGAIDRASCGFEPGHQIIAWQGLTTLEKCVGGSGIRHLYGLPAEQVDRKAYAELTDVLAAGLWNTVVHWSPDILVLAGPLMNEENGFRLTEVRAALERIYSGIRTLPRLPEIRLGTLGDNAGLLGAMLLLPAVVP